MPLRPRLYKTSVDHVRQMGMRSRLDRSCGDCIARNQNDHPSLMMLRPKWLVSNDDDGRKHEKQEHGGEHICNYFAKLHAALSG